MSTAIEKLQAAQQRAMSIRPKVGGFPYLAETLRRAGVTRNLWYLPACESLYLTDSGPVMSLGTPLVSGTSARNAASTTGLTRADAEPTFSCITSSKTDSWCSTSTEINPMTVTVRWSSGNPCLPRIGFADRIAFSQRIRCSFSLFVIPVFDLRQQRRKTLCVSFGLHVGKR
jgi:hypothetical protein